MSFVKASVIHDPCESVRYVDQISELLNKKGKVGIGYERPESSKSGWLKNRLDKENEKAGSKSSVQNQQRCGSKKVNWSKILFGVLKEMVDKTLKKSKGFVAQICVLLKGDPTVTMGESTTFPPLKILSAKTVKTCIATNETIDARGKADEPGVAKIARSKKRPIATGDEPAVTKKKRTSKRKASPSKDNMDIVSVAQEAIPLQTFEPSTAVHVEKRACVEDVRADLCRFPRETGRSQAPRRQQAISLDRSVFREANNVDSVVQRARLLLLTDSGTHKNSIGHMDIDQRPDSPSTSDNSSMRFDEDDTAATQFSLPAISTDLTEAFAQLRASVEQIHFEQIRYRAYRALLNNIRKDIHDQKTLLSLDVLTSQQKLSTQVTVVALDNADIRKEVKEQRAILTDLDGQVATVRSALRLAPTGFTGNLALQGAWLQPDSQGICLFKVGGGRSSLIRSTTGNKNPLSACIRRPGIRLAVGPQPLWLRNRNFGLAQRIMVKRLATSPHDPLGITDSACKNQLVVVSVQYGPFNTYIPIRSTTIGKSRVARDPDIHAYKRAVNPRQRSIDSYMHRDLTQSRHLMTPSESVNGSK
ncbi:hypothetical protein F511_37879 [Dorcoceras hygrometricum]|uniref:Uncharacterized protein n=1 Tax=Dorcoceras hygrometricum TaxID=472368 RepID=A0A2Z7B952_9LAMI|nr:hypothetical protein F511_37879 [Dorcoceras hygrometricum]